jgi:hypothetical protein
VKPSVSLRQRWQRHPAGLARAFTASIVVLLAIGGCTGHRTDDYHDPAGWTIEVPPGWHVVPFSLRRAGISASGAQVSNTALPPPSIVPGSPIQANGLILPHDGIAVIITTDTDPRTSQPATALPPLSLDEFTGGSALAGAPRLDVLWFGGDGRTFLATVKTGADASSADLREAADLVRSLRFDGVAA